MPWNYPFNESITLPVVRRLSDRVGRNEPNAILDSSQTVKMVRYRTLISRVTWNAE